MNQVPTRIEHLGFGKVVVPRNTALKMREVILESHVNPYVRKWAERITEDVRDRDEYGEVNAIFRFVQNSLHYLKDPRGMEYVQTPPYILEHIQVGSKPGADCDDYTTLGLSLLASIGYKTAIRVTGYNQGGEFTHVYGLVSVHGKWVPFDAIRKDVGLGWEAPNKTVKMDIGVT